jgi:hypothetical protein
MAYNTKSIKKDVDGKPIPQIFDMVKDDYEVLQGRNGAQRVEIYGPDGNPLSSTSGKLNIRASELETLLSALGAKDFATQTTLAQILAKLSADPATETTLAGGIVSLLSAIAETASETTAAAILAKLEAGIDTTLTGSNMELYGASVDDRPDATTVPIGTTFTIVDDTHDFKTWMSNGVDWGEEI